MVGGNGRGTITLFDVTSDVTINSTYSGAAYHGGLVGYAMNAYFTGCAFTGSLLGENSNSCGGMVGYKSGTRNTAADFVRCFFHSLYGG